MSKDQLKIISGSLRVINYLSFLKTSSFVEFHVQLMDDQIINKRTDRIRRKRGPNGSANPIKKTISTGIIAKDRMAAPLSALHNPQPAIHSNVHAQRHDFVFPHNKWFSKH